MKRMKWLCGLIVFAFCFVLSSEMAQNYLSDFTEQFYYIDASPEDRQMLCDVLLNVSAQHQTPVLAVQKEYPTSQAAHITVYIPQNNMSSFQNEFSLQPGLYRSFFSGETEIQYKDFTEIQAQADIERFYFQAASMREMDSMLENIMPESDRTLLVPLNSLPVSQELLLNSISKIIVDTLVTNIVSASTENLMHLLNEYDEQTILEMESNHELIRHAISYDILGDDTVRNTISEFKNNMSRIALNNYHVQRSDSKGMYIIKNLFEAYNTNPQQLPNYAIKNLYKELKRQGYNFQKQFNSVSDDDISELRSTVVDATNDIKNKNDIAFKICIMRTICDHIARMTDNYAIGEYEKLYG